jgi:uncharacterized protein (TIGR02453 family)
MDIKKVLSFLSTLKDNNNKEWFDQHRPEWEAIKKDFNKFIADLILEISKFDKSIEGLQAKDCIFRINKDVRFSKDKSPYKTNIGAIINKGGKKSNFAGYYIHIEPQASMIAGGIYMPDAPLIKSIRQEIDYNFESFEKVLNHKLYKKYFEKMSGDKLVSVPKGYDESNPSIAYLKHKSFLSIYNISTKEIEIKHIVEVCKAMKPFNDFLNQAVISN